LEDGEGGDAEEEAGGLDGEGDGGTEGEIEGGTEGLGEMLEMIWLKLALALGGKALEGGTDGPTLGLMAAEMSDVYHLDEDLNRQAFQLRRRPHQQE
jgi:hypothetical protein